MTTDAPKNRADVIAALPPPRWVTPLESFLGEEEPSDDDAEDWNVRDLIPRGEPFIWGGPPKGGKTWAMLDLAICVAMGLPWLAGAFENTRGEPRRVLVIALEDGQRRLRKRVWELCRGRELTPNDATLRAHLSISREPLRMPDARDERTFVAELRAWRPDVVILDNLTRIMVGDQNAIKDVARFTQLWTKLCTDVGAAVGFLHHTSKPTSERTPRDPFDMLRGSGDLMAATRNAVVSMPIKVPDERISEVHIRGNLDLRREGLAVGFYREQVCGKWQVKLVDKGDVAAFRSAARVKKADEAAKEKAASSAERRAVAIAMAQQNNLVTSRWLAEALKVSPNTALKVLQALEADGAMEVVQGKNGGYRLCQDDPREGS